MIRKERLSKRFFEIIPGVIAWVMITSPIWGGIFFPVQIAYFILIFNSFWVYKSFSAMIFFIVGFFRIRNAENVNWLKKVKRLENIDVSIGEIKKEIETLESVKFDKKRFEGSYLQRLPGIFKRLLFYFEKKKTVRYLRGDLSELKNLKEKEILNWKEIHHVIIVPFWKEPYSVLKRSLDKLVEMNFPKDQISVMLGAEARHPPAFELAKRLQREYKDKFANVWINNHVLTKDEIGGKASNMADCGRKIQKEIEKLGWDKSKVTITSCDCDTQFDKQYLAYFTYLFVTDKDRYYRFYAAPMVYYANFWKVPFYSRVANTLFTINNIGQAVRVDKYIQVSSYSFSWRLLEDIDFWSSDVMPEDFHMFFKALYLHGNKVITVPMYLKNLADAAESVDHPGTIKNQYEQVKRWAWGVSDHGWMIKSFFKSSKKSFYTFYRMFHTIYDHITWSIISFLLLFGANIPPLVNEDFSNTVLGQKLPQISSFMLTVTSIGFVTTIILDFFLKPRREEKVSIFRFVLEQFQWITFPVITFVFSALPGLDAQTRLLFGKYLEYRLTEKH